jgi:hypothetical protein
MTWIQTVSGRQFWPLAPKAEDVDVGDIAHALSMKCRYSGHTQKFYSVAEHCVHISNAILEDGWSPGTALWGLLHDAAEAYLPDIARPIKPAMPGFGAIEEAVEKAIVDKIVLDVPGWFCSLIRCDIVKAYDTRILIDEKAAMMPHTPADWGLAGPALGVQIVGWDPTEAKVRFLRAYENLVGLIEARA